MKKMRVFILIALLSVGAYFLYDALEVEPETIIIKPAEKVENKKANDESDAIEIIPKETRSIEKRYSKLPFEYPEYPKTEVPETFKNEVHTKFIDWIENNIPPETDAEFATWDAGFLPKIEGEINFYKTRSTPDNVRLLENWKFSKDEKAPCVLYLIFPHYEFDLLNEYWVKFVLHQGFEGKVFSFFLRHTERSGFIWKFAGQSIE